MAAAKISEPKVTRYGVVINLPMEIPLPEQCESIDRVIGMFKMKRECLKSGARRAEYEQAISVLKFARFLDGELETMYKIKYTANLVISFPTKEAMEEFVEKLNLAL